MKKLIIALSVLLSGCAGFNSIDGGHPVDCTAHFQSGTFAVPGYYKVHIDREKYDRFGRHFLRPQSNMDIHFVGGGFKSADLFTNVECK